MSEAPVASVSVADLLRVPGQLCINPTALTANGFPGTGGTALGKVIDVSLKPGRGYTFIQEEAGGKAVQDAIDTGESWILAVTLEDLDDATLNLAFCDTTTGASGRRIVRYPGSFSPGTLVSGKAARLVFWPDDEARHNFVVMWRALPLVEESAELKHRLDTDMGTPLIFVATLGTKADAATERALEWGLRSDITL